MFDIGFLELIIIGIVALLVMGPERLPGAVRTSMRWISKLRSSFQQIKAEVEREVGVDEMRQQIHNDAIMQNLEKTKKDLESGLQQTTNTLKSDLDKLQYDVSDIVEANSVERSSKTPNSDSKEPATKS
ncbi:MAG: Sec-independent protein translocase protein TatB [Spongiibacteraceae bacterium]